MRHGERTYFEIADREAIVAVESVDALHVRKTLAGDFERPKRQPDGNFIARRERRNAADVIVVFVRDDDSGEGFWCDADACEARGRVTNAKTAVDQNARRAGFDNEPVAFAAAADRREAHQGTCYLS